MDRLKEIEKRLADITVELDSDAADIDALEAEVTALKEERKALQEKAEKRKKLIDDIVTETVGTPSVTITPPKEEQQVTRTKDELLTSAEYRSAFLKNLQGHPLNEAEKRTYDLLVTLSGAPAVPEITANMIFDHMMKIAPVLNEIQLLRVAGNLRFAVQGVRDIAQPHVENAPINPAQDTLVQVTLTGYEFVKVIRISAAMQTMSISAFESWLVKILGEDLAIALNNQIINGGTVTGSISTAQVWVNGTNQITFVPGAGGGGLTYDDITNLIALLPAQFDGNAKFLMNKATFYTQVMQVRDGNGSPLAIQDLAAPGKFRILGYPVLIDDHVHDNEAYLGDYKQVVGNLSSDIKIDRSTESGFLTNSVDYRGTAIFDCDVAQPTAIVKLNS